jgi:hypothetical protein
MKQKMRFNDAELALIKSLFAEDESMITAVRKIFFEVELTKAENLKIKACQTDKAKTLIRKIFIPELNLDAPVGQMIDLLMTINFAEKDPAMAHLHMRARHAVISLLDAHLKELQGETPTLSFKPLAVLSDDSEQDFVNLTARNSYVSHVEAMLQQINLLAGMKNESPEQTQERLQKDSSK